MSSVGDTGGWEAVLGLVFPPVCQVCHDERATAAEGYVGEACRRQVRIIQPPYCQRCGLPVSGAVTQEFTCSNCRDLPFDFGHARSAAEAKGPVLEAIHQFKYQRALWFRRFLTDLLLDAALPELRASPRTWDGIVPVPLHPVKQREREFNQAEVLAEPLAQALGIPVRTDLVRRRVATGSQTTLGRGERAENVERAFAGVPGPDLAGRRFIVVDDVFTTGATTNGVARVLRGAGAEEVVVWTVARGV